MYSNHVSMRLEDDKPIPSCTSNHVRIRLEDDEPVPLSSTDSLPSLIQRFSKQQENNQE